MILKDQNQIVINARFLTQNITGVQRFAIELSKALKKEIPDIIFVAPDNIVHKELADLLNVKIIGRTKNGLLWEQVELPIYLNKIGRPLLINLGNIAPLFYSNNIIAIMDLSFLKHPEWFSKKFTLLYNFIIPLAVKKARHVLTISNYSKSDICESFLLEENRVEIIYPAISEIFLNKKIMNRNLENKYGEYILAVSSLDPRKNFKRLIKAFKSCQLPSIKLVIVGASHKLFASDKELQSLIEGDPSIIFTGYVNDIELIFLYKNAVLFAYPSLFEGFGLPPLEAMACGCVTLVSNTTSLPEVCGSASIYVDPYDVKSIKEGILKGLNDDSFRTELIQKGYDRVVYFDFNKSVKKMISLINTLKLA